MRESYDVLFKQLFFLLQLNLLASNLIHEILDFVRKIRNERKKNREEGVDECLNFYYYVTTNLM